MQKNKPSAKKHLTGSAICGKIKRLYAEVGLGDSSPITASVAECNKKSKGGGADFINNAVRIEEKFFRPD